MTPGFSISARIRKSPEVVYDAIVDPDQLGRYFTTHASGPLVEGQTVIWRWDGVASDTHVDSVQRPVKIVFRWRAFKVDYDTTCTFDFETLPEGQTKLTVTETGWQHDPAGLESSYEHCSGWQHMMLCLKAWLEHGIDLRV
jgi:uncharacterized protein YndB with AHSA1/START domain